MKKIIYSLLAAASMLYACNFSAGTNTNLLTSLHYSYHGFSVEEVLLVGADNVAMNDNEVPFNSKVSIVAQGLSNYELKNDKANPGLSLILTDKEGTAIINEADLFANGDGYSPEDASALRGTVTVGDPMKAGETYHFKIHIWDKNKPENELTAEADIDVK